MGFTQSIEVGFRKFLTFSGRATRSEFWWFCLSYFGFCFLIGIILTAIAPTLLEDGPIDLISLILSIPIWAAASRRLHDIGKSGWWQLIGLTGIALIILIVWWATGTEQKDNKYGPLEQS